MKVQLALVILLSQLLRASEPKKSLCSRSSGKDAYLSKLPCAIRKRLRLLSLVFENDPFLLTPQSGPRRALKPVQSRQGEAQPLHLHKEKGFKRSCFSPLVLLDFFFPP